MNRTTLTITLDADAVFTRSSATVGRPASLDRIPGATLLGAAAARLYNELGDRAVEAFELAGILFGDALPIAEDGAIALPTPLSWHREKRGSRVYDLSQIARPVGQQLSQIRSAWRVAEGTSVRTVQVDRRSSMRTAIDAGQAREGFLYGVEAIPRGTRFATTIASQDAALLNKAVAALTSSSIRLGRSRSAEFGSAIATISDARPSSDPVEPAVTGRLRLLLVSDLCLREPQTGGPRLTPTAADFGLGNDWSLDLEFSFLRFRRYSPFNGHRRRPETEHQVIVAGSVLTFSGPGLNAAGLARLREALSKGVGLHTGRGLGQLLAEPALLAHAEPTIQAAARSSTRVPLAKPPTDPAFAVFRARADSTRRDAEIWTLAVEASGRFNSTSIRGAQLGAIRKRAAEARLEGLPRERFMTGLKEQFSRGVVGRDWGNPAVSDAPSAVLLATLERFPARPDAEFLTFVELLASRVERELKGKAGES